LPKWAFWTSVSGQPGRIIIADGRSILLHSLLCRFKEV
jgi:hypothetical protein